MRDTWRKLDLWIEIYFSKIYFYLTPTECLEKKRIVTLLYIQNNNSNKVDSRENAYRLSSLLGQTRSLDMQFKKRLFLFCKHYMAK
jgi:hypothetical protein